MTKIIAASLLIAPLILATSASSFDVDGRIAASYMNQDDSISTHDYNIASTSLKLDVSNFAGENKFFHLNCRIRKAGSNDFNSKAPDYRVRDANLEIKKIYKQTDLVLGRQYIDGLPGARVDGLLLKFEPGEHYGFGIFAGLMPEPYEEGFTSDYASSGLYGYIKNKDSRLSLGYERTTYKGKEDSSYIYSSGNYRPNRNIYFYLSARGDRNMDSNSVELTNLLATATYRIGKISRLRMTYNRYRAVKLYESMDYDLNRDVQSAWRLYADYSVRKTTRVYGRYDLRTRSSDDKSAYLYMAGVRESRLFKWFFADLSYRFMHYFTADIKQYYVSAGVDTGKNVTMQFDYTRAENHQDNAPNKLDQEIYGVSIDWYGKNRIFVTGRYEESREKYLPIESIFTAQVNDYKTRTIFLTAGYRF